MLDHSILGVARRRAGRSPLGNLPPQGNATPLQSVSPGKSLAASSSKKLTHNQHLSCDLSPGSEARPQIFQIIFLALWQLWRADSPE